jgi:hypothetical protein
MLIEAKENLPSRVWEDCKVEVEEFGLWSQEGVASDAGENVNGERVLGDGKRGFWEA